MDDDDDDEEEEDIINFPKLKFFIALYCLFYSSTIVFLLYLWHRKEQF